MKELQQFIDPKIPWEWEMTERSDGSFDIEMWVDVWSLNKKQKTELLKMSSGEYLDSVLKKHFPKLTFTCVYFEQSIHIATFDSERMQISAQGYRKTF